MIEALISKVVDREGGYVNHSADRGGPTNMGVTQRTLSEWRGKPVSIAEVKALTKPEVVRIYTQRYWLDPGFDRLGRSVIIEDMLLDASVHHGAVGAAKLLQRAARVTADGDIGPETRRAVEQMPDRMLAAAFMAERVAKLGAIITENPSQAVFAAGWMNRMKGFIKLIPMA